MNKKLLFFVFMFGFCFCVTGNAAVAIKKSSNVAKQESASSATAGSLVPTVLGLVGNVQQLNAQQRALSEKCVPTSQEISFVNDMVKEWAMTGAATSDEAFGKLNVSPCSGFESYATTAADANNSTVVVCYDKFSESEKIWDGYPKVGLATFCSDGASTCNSNKQKKVSNIWEIFSLIDFSAQDYTKSESSLAADLLAKQNDCTPARLNAKKKEALGEFVSNTLSNVGQPTNTGTIMQAVTSAVNSGGGLGSLSTLGSFVTPLMDK